MSTRKIRFLPTSAASIAAFFSIFVAIIFIIILVSWWFSAQRMSSTKVKSQLQANRLNDIIQIDTTISINGLLEAIRVVNEVDQRQILSVVRAIPIDSNIGPSSELALKNLDELRISTGFNKREGLAEVTVYHLKLVNQQWTIVNKSGWVS